MSFSPQLIAMLAAESKALGLRNATEITVALREQMVDTRKGGDGRAKEYWIAARVVDQGISHPMPGEIKITGLDALSLGADGAWVNVGGPGCTRLSPDCAKSQIGAARVSLTRKGEAHVQVLLPHSKQAPDVPDAWVDLYVFRDQKAAAAHAAGLKAGKVF